MKTTINEYSSHAHMLYIHIYIYLYVHIYIHRFTPQSRLVLISTVFLWVLFYFSTFLILFLLTVHYFLTTVYVRCFNSLYNLNVFPKASKLIDGFPVRFYCFTGWHGRPVGVTVSCLRFLMNSKYYTDKINNLTITLKYQPVLLADAPWTVN